ncbi:MAG TPA: response regulator transcription factor [Candidatus Nitrosotalea sp.]|nr:response regulator transcription factor [Candidatus Nitrosotalea sp.]
MTTVLVATRTAAARARLERAVAGSPGLRLVATPPGGPLSRQVATLHPDVVLLDLDGPRVASALASLGDEARAALVVLADAPGRVLRETTGSRDLVRAVLPRDATASEIRAAIEAVVAGLVALHPDALDAPARGAPLPAGSRSEPDQPLTARELEVLEMMADGLGNKIIAARLGISTHTAKFHVASIMAKLGASSRTEAVSIGMRRGLVAI